MRLHHAVFVALLITPILVTAQENLGKYEDRIAVEDAGDTGASGIRIYKSVEFLAEFFFESLGFCAG